MRGIYGIYAIYTFARSQASIPLHASKHTPLCHTFSHTHEYLDAPKYAQEMRKTKRVKAHANKHPASVRPLPLIELMQLAALLSPKRARTMNGLCPSSPCMPTHLCQFHSVRPLALHVCPYPSVSPSVRAYVSISLTHTFACQSYSHLSLPASGLASAPRFRPRLPSLPLSI